MPSPVTPSQFRQLIMSVTGNFCEKFLNLLNMPKLWSDWFSYTFDESGNFTDEFKADVCAIGCGGTGTGTTGELGNPSISASDGQFADKIQVSWTAVSGALVYDLYRNTQNNSATAIQIAHDLSSTSYADLAVTPGTYYYYWVVGRNATQSSGKGNGDRGFAGAVSATLAAIADLACTQGFSRSQGDKIGLVFTPVAGAETYDFYRNTSDDFSTAAKFDSGRSPFDNSASFSSGPTRTGGSDGQFVDNGGELVYYHDPGAPAQNDYTVFYFWVIAVRSGPPAVSPPSNGGMGAKGWVVGKGLGIPQSSSNVLSSGGADSDVTTPGVTMAWIVLYGSGAGGAGGDLAVGGGGGGGGAMITGTLAVVAGSRFRVVSTPENDTPNAASAANGDAGSITKLQYSALGTFADTVDLCTANAPSGGVYDAGGAGAGGAGASGVNGALTGIKVYDGRNGTAASSQKGGRGGQRFGGTRTPPAHFAGYTGGGGFAGDGGTRGAGGGSYSSPLSATLARGGKGQRGIALIIYYV